MLPTLNITGNVVLVDRISPRFSKIAAGDIVIVGSPENPTKVITKRLIGVEDDSITYLVDPKHTEKCNTVVVSSFSFFFFLKGLIFILTLYFNWTLYVSSCFYRFG